MPRYTVQVGGSNWVNDRVFSLAENALLRALSLLDGPAGRDTRVQVVETAEVNGRRTRRVFYPNAAIHSIWNSRRRLARTRGYFLMTRLQDEGETQHGQYESLEEATNEAIRLINAPLGASCMYRIWSFDDPTTGMGGQVTRATNEDLFATARDNRRRQQAEREASEAARVVTTPVIYDQNEGKFYRDGREVHRRELSDNEASLALDRAARRDWQRNRRRDIQIEAPVSWMDQPPITPYSADPRSDGQGVDPHALEEAELDRLSEMEREAQHHIMLSAMRQRRKRAKRAGKRRLPPPREQDRWDEI